MHRYMEPNIKSKIEYSSEEYIRPICSVPNNESKIEQWLINHSFGKINDKKQASVFLLGLVVFIFIIILFLLLGQDGNPKRQASPFRNHNATNLQKK